MRIVCDRLIQWRLVCAMAILAILLPCLAGCSDTGARYASGDKSRLAHPEDDLPVDQAWAKLKQDQKGSFLGQLIKGRNGKPIDQAEIDASLAQERLATASLGSISTRAFDNIVRDVAVYLVKELPAPHGIAQERKQVLVVDKVVNRTGVRDASLDGSLESLHIKLFQEPPIQANFVVLAQNVEKGQQALEKARAGEPLEFTDPMAGDGGAGAKVVRYNPNSIYKVTGQMFQDLNEVKAKHRMYLKMLVEVWHPQSGQTVKGQEFSREYRFHPYRLEWITAEEDDRLAQTASVR